MFCNNLAEGTITTPKVQSGDDQLTYKRARYSFRLTPFPTSSPPRGGISPQEGRYSKMNTKYNDFWLNKSNKTANTYMDEVAKESNFTGHHKGYTILPYKIHRCYGLNLYEKLILVDIIAYMSDQSQCYPTVEMMARNIGCSSKSIERHIGQLAQKKLILVSQSKNNTYYLPNYFHVHPYLLCLKRRMSSSGVSGSK
ncbi:hypothetical protein D3C76_719050 [compost metagenome]